MALLVACSPQKRLNRLLMKYPELRDTVVIHDTVDAIVEYVRADTVFLARYHSTGDTVTLTKDRLRVRYVRMPGDTVYLSGECLGDTIRVPWRVEVPVVQPTKTLDRVPWYLWVVLGLLAMALVLNTIKR
jgi:hypothetical protein